MKRTRWFGIGVLTGSYAVAALAKRFKALSGRFDLRSRAVDSRGRAQGRWTEARRAGRLAAMARERDLMAKPLRLPKDPDPRT
ncbi:MAG: hypothetical protein KAZ88_02075 [Acidimicrobiia bacterium]|jgi:hypothetical protein|nr:hypothetical protein [Acidimicrobiia bacterium]MBP8179761.1 hypothetical protein [Acidimicrobiia bacterium]